MKLKAGNRLRAHVENEAASQKLFIRGELWGITKISLGKQAIGRKALDQKKASGIISLC